MTRRTYINPERPMGETMRRLILSALDAHPDGEAYRALAELQVGGRIPEHVRYRFSTGRQPLLLRAGRTTYKLLDNPATLAAHGLAVARCDGWTGKRTPRKALVGGCGVVMYRHPQGWALAIAEHRHAANYADKAWPLQVGPVTLTMDYYTQTIAGSVPASWLVDLNAGPVMDEATINPQLEIAA
jgi:hypothetical protein